MCDYSSQVSCSIGLKLSGDLSWNMRHVINYIRAWSVKKKFSTLLPPWKWEIEGSLNPKLEKKTFLSEMVWESEKNHRKLISRKKKFFASLWWNFFFPGWVWPKMKKKIFLLEMVWEGEKSHRKLISRKKYFFASLWWNFFFGVGFDHKWKKNFFCWKWSGRARKLIGIWFCGQKYCGGSQRPKAEKERPKAEREAAGRYTRPKASHQPSAGTSRIAPVGRISC